MDRPLEDVRILSFEQYAAGPYGTLHLADLGAEIIKVELPSQPDVGRSVPPYLTDDDSLFFQALNRNKLGICLDVARPRGRQVLEDLVRVSDAVYSNLRGDVPEKLGIRYNDLRHVNPRIVCTSLSGFGMSGPRAGNPGFDYMIQGISGWMSITGEPDAPPTKTGLSAVDFSSGIVAALSTVVAIHAARRDNVGCDCDLSLLDTAMSMLSYLGTWAASRGYEPVRIARSSHPTLVPFGNFPTKDGWVVAGGSKEKFWVRLAGALGLAGSLGDPRFRTFEDRLEFKDELIAILDAIFKTQTTKHWLTTLSAAGVPCAPINTIAEALRDPQVLAREMIVHLQHPKFGHIAHIRSPARVGDTRPEFHHAPIPGEHTKQVMQGLLGYSAETLRELADLDVIGGPGI